MLLDGETKLNTTPLAINECPIMYKPFGCRGRKKPNGIGKHLDMH
jgi:hypothetical protein